ncbi:MAG: response regulator transcription factor [Pseudonocardiales bacterium]|nr:response regulator transcription factor [Pseudonocardiales bacterium]
MRALVVENDTTLAESLIRGLRRHGYHAESVDTGTRALHTYHRADLVLLDLDLPDLDGLEVCRAIRVLCDIPIIAVTARCAELDRVLGLQAGLDDYVVKPYGFRELIARIDAVMRRARPRQPLVHTMTHGPLRIDFSTREVRLNDQLIHVTRKEFDLLYLLACQPDAVVSRQHIMSKVWDVEWTKYSRTIDTHVNSLRKKLGASTWIITVRGIGFRFGHGGETLPIAEAFGSSSCHGALQTPNSTAQWSAERKLGLR